MRKSIGYNDFLHTKLLGVLGDSFVKRSGSEYRKVYDDYKNRVEWRTYEGYTIPESYAEAHLWIQRSRHETYIIERVTDLE